MCVQQVNVTWVVGSLQRDVSIGDFSDVFVFFSEEVKACLELQAPSLKCVVSWIKEGCYHKLMWVCMFCHVYALP